MASYTYLCRFAYRFCTVVLITIIFLYKASPLVLARLILTYDVYLTNKHSAYSPVQYPQSLRHVSGTPSNEQ